MAIRISYKLRIGVAADALFAPIDQAGKVTTLRNRANLTAWRWKSRRRAPSAVCGAHPSLPQLWAGALNWGYISDICFRQFRAMTCCASPADRRLAEENVS